MAFAAMTNLASKATEVADLLRELANDKRLMILCTLLDGKETSVAELGKRVSLSQSALSQHLARLRACEMVASRREGTTVYYRVSDSRIARLMKSLRTIYC